MTSPALLAELTPVAGDFVFAGIAVGFFVLAMTFIWFCKKVR